MSVEDRVRVLEEELRILKNEIHAILLDIQQQIFLRRDVDPEKENRSFTGEGLGDEEIMSSHDLDSEPIQDSDESPIFARKTKLNPPPDRDFSHDVAIPPWDSFFSEMDDDEEEDREGSTPAKEMNSKNFLKEDETISLEEFQQMLANPPLPENIDEPESESLDSFLEELMVKPDPIPVDPVIPAKKESITPEKTDKTKPPYPPINGGTGKEKTAEKIPDENVLSKVSRLLDWVEEGVSVIGKKRTVEAIEMYAKHERMSLEMKDLLLKLSDITPESSPPKGVSIKQVIETLSQLNKILNQGEERVDLNFILTFLEDEKLEQS